MYPAEYRYTKEHEWIKKEGAQATVGITDFAQKELGDIVFVDLPAAGKKYNTGEAFGSIESVKAVSEVYAPVAMEVVEVNPILAEQPEVINKDSHNAGWLVRIKLMNDSDYGALLTAAQYEELISQEKH